MTSPPVIVRDVIIVGSSVWDWWGRDPSPPGDVRGFDVRTGRQLWTFNTIPHAGEPGVETWEKDSWKETGNANVWAPMSADEQLGYVYLPISTPTNDYYGGHRPGDGLYGDSLVCIEAATGKKIWHYQLIRHGLRDYDTPQSTASASRQWPRSPSRPLSTRLSASRANLYGQSRIVRCPPPASLASVHPKLSRSPLARHPSTSRA